MNLIRAFPFKKVAVIVAHPDDETLWAGGMILMHPQCQWTILSLCRADDPDRAPKFFKAATLYGATGLMGTLSDGPEQEALPLNIVEQTITSLLPAAPYDLIITHSPAGEYTRHKRHEETGRAVLALWKDKKITAPQAWLFAYGDGDRKDYPKAISSADRTICLPREIWRKKYAIVTQTYGFLPDSFEARTTPEKEAFWCMIPEGNEPVRMEGKT